MKNFLILILTTGLAVGGWMNRDKLSDLWSKTDTTEEDVAQRAPSTPHPAREAQAQATAIYPGLARTDSALNKKFVALYKDAQVTDPALLSRPDWPLQLADRAIVALGGAPMPRSGGAAPVAQARPNKQVIIYTTANCPYCKQAKQYMAQKGVHYIEVNIETSLSGKEDFRKLGGNGVPLIIVGSQRLDGFDAQKLDRLLL